MHDGEMPGKYYVTCMYIITQNSGLNGMLQGGVLSRAHIRYTCMLVGMVEAVNIQLLWK